MAARYPRSRGLLLLMLRYCVSTSPPSPSASSKSTREDNSPLNATFRHSTTNWRFGETPTVAVRTTDEASRYRSSHRTYTAAFGASTFGILALTDVMPGE